MKQRIFIFIFLKSTVAEKSHFNLSQHVPGAGSAGEASHKVSETSVQSVSPPPTLQWIECRDPGARGSKNEASDESVTIDKSGNNNNPVQTAERKKNRVEVSFVCSVRTHAAETIEITQINSILCPPQPVVKVCHASVKPPPLCLL